MDKTIIIKNIEEINPYIESLRQSAEESMFKLDEISSHSDPLEFLSRIKFEQVGFDPLDTQRPLNFIEQLNQTFTYLASFMAVKLLFKWHVGLTELTLNLGTKSGTDIESSFDGGIAAEVFSAVKPNNNSKLRKDLKKISAFKAFHKYVFFLCPDYEEGPYSNPLENDVLVWSLGYNWW